jgi:hypothetical protein
MPVKHFQNSIIFRSPTSALAIATLLVVAIAPMGNLATASEITIADSPTPRVNDRPGGREPGGNRAPLPEIDNAPGGREPGATRSANGCLEEDKALAIVQPVGDRNRITTSAIYPTFFFYLPETSAPKAEFVLTDDRYQEIYKTTFDVFDAGSTIRVTIPASLLSPTLEVGSEYTWSFSLLCNPNEPSGNIFIQGTIERMMSSGGSGREMMAASASDRLARFLEEENWTDALIALADLRRENPNDRSLRDRWTSLLQELGLEDYASEPLVQP